MAEIIEANGVRIAYRLDGPENGPVVMLSNSLATNFAMWDAQIPALTDKYRVLRYDQRGHGGSQATEPPYSFDLLLEDACALIRALGFGPVHFCGLSMGGMTGQLFGAKRPELLRSLILCDTSSQMPDQSIWDARIKAARGEGMASLVPSTIERWFTPAYRAREKAEIERVGRMIAATQVNGYVGCCNAIAAMNHTPLLAQIKTPTLIVVGADDPATTVAHSQVIHRAVSGSELVVLQNAAHLSNIEQAAKFNAALRSFLDRH